MVPRFRESPMSHRPLWISNIDQTFRHLQKEGWASLRIRVRANYKSLNEVNSSIGLLARAVANDVAF
jgi:hypothetical protein